ncbi:hypothetical protein VA7868_00919 [Vibrio aerogenes CECT 7868]|uniref:Uncharacterized protein n=2 Tax=Vibrio aerogenes TaxID=92172 RepID=A0A1M5WXJ0_9VIBR|nr:hypothetical protein VA7868_00919 [Vibrio aerogenes CECT 7868]
MRKLNFSNWFLECIYIVTLIQLGSTYYIIFKDDGDVVFLLQHVYTIKSDLIKLVSILMPFYIVFWGLLGIKNTEKHNKKIPSPSLLNQKVLKTKIQPKNLLIQCIISVPLFIIFIFILHFLSLIIGKSSLLNEFYDDKITYIYTYFIFCPFYFYLYYNHHKKTEKWRLDEKQLSCGKPVIFSVKLDDIDTIIVGTPVKKLSDNILFRLYSKKNSKTFSTRIDGSIIIKLKNKKYINLNISHLYGGGDIIQKILHIKFDKVNDNYQFSTEERRLFGSRKRNRLLSLKSE